MENVESPKVDAKADLQKQYDLMAKEYGHLMFQLSHIQERIKALFEQMTKVGQELSK